MMQILKNNNEFDVLSNIEIINNLPNGNYHLKYGAFGRIYLSKEDDIILPEKVYSNDTLFINHILHQWSSNIKQLGVGLIGGKGLGKSFTGNIICDKMNIPIIRIMDNPKGLDIFSFLNKIKQDHIIYIDEFEKIFPININNNNNDSNTSQEKFLSFLDNGGEILDHKRCFIITSNSESHINEFLKNRPSRLRYINRYNSLSEEIIKEIVNDLLVDKSFLTDLIEHLPYNGLNMDSLIQIINEVNYHHKPYSEFKKFFNFVEIGSTKSYTVTSLEGIMLADDISHIYSGDDICKYKGNTLYFSKTVPLISDTINTTAYYYDDNDKTVIIEVLLTKNKIPNRFQYLV